MYQRCISPRCTGLCRPCAGVALYAAYIGLSEIPDRTILFGFYVTALAIAATLSSSWFLAQRPS